MITRADDRLMPVDMRTWNPRGCLVSVIDDLAEARQAALALREAGFGDDDVRLAPAQEVAAIGDLSTSSKSFARSVRDLVSFGDERIVAARYLDEARCGHHLLIVYALRDDLKRHARAVMARHQAHTILYYGRWVITSRV